MTLKTSAEYRAALFAQLEVRGVTREVIARLWRVLGCDDPTNQQLYNALNPRDFEQPTELQRSGFPGKDVQEAEIRAEAQIARSVEVVCAIAATLETREADAECERRRIEALLEHQLEATATEAPRRRPSAPETDLRKRMNEDQGVGNVETPENLH